MYLVVLDMGSNRFRDCPPEMYMVVMDMGSNGFGDSLGCYGYV